MFVKHSPRDSQQEIREPKRITYHMQGKFAGFISAKDGVAWRVTKDRADWRTGAVTWHKPGQNMKDLEAWGVPNFGGRELWRMIKRQQSRIQPPTSAATIAEETKKEVKITKKRSLDQAKDYCVRYMPLLPPGRKDSTKSKTVKFKAWDDQHAWGIADDIMSEGRTPLASRQQAKVYRGALMVPRV